LQVKLVFRPLVLRRARYMPNGIAMVRRFSERPRAHLDG
jgi:hypothetical protein